MHTELDTDRYAYIIHTNTHTAYLPIYKYAVY